MHEVLGVLKDRLAEGGLHDEQPEDRLQRHAPHHRAHADAAPIVRQGEGNAEEHEDAEEAAQAIPDRGGVLLFAAHPAEETFQLAAPRVARVGGDQLVEALVGQLAVTLVEVDLHQVGGEVRHPRRVTGEDGGAAQPLGGGEVVGLVRQDAPECPRRLFVHAELQQRVAAGELGGDVDGGPRGRFGPRRRRARVARCRLRRGAGDIARRRLRGRSGGAAPVCGGSAGPISRRCLRPRGGADHQDEYTRRRSQGGPTSSSHRRHCPRRRRHGANYLRAALAVERLQT